MSNEVLCLKNLGTRIKYRREGERGKEWWLTECLEKMGWDQMGVRQEWDPESPSASCLLADSSSGFPCTFCKAY